MSRPIRARTKALRNSSGVQAAKSDFAKDSADKNVTQKNARPGSEETPDKNQDGNKNNVTVHEENEGKDGASSDDGGAESEKGTEVSLAIVGAGGKIIFGPGKVIIKDDNKWGVTALGALDASGVEYRISSRFAGFVGKYCRRDQRRNEGLDV
jgi:hypothetical protein